MFKSLLFFSWLLLASLHANTLETPFKRYCQADQVEIDDSSIAIHLEEGIFALDSIAADRGGIYFYPEALRCPECYRPINPKNTCENPSCPLRN